MSKKSKREILMEYECCLFEFAFKAIGNCPTFYFQTRSQGSFAVGLVPIVLNCEYVHTIVQLHRYDHSYL